MAEALITPTAGTGTEAATAAQALAQDSDVTPGAYQGWNVWRRAVNATFVQQLNQADDLRQATLRVLGGG